MDDLRQLQETHLAYVQNYTFADAAKYLRMPPSTVRYWAKGGSVTTPERRIHFEQVLQGPPRAALTFLDLTELMVVRELRERFNVSLRSIRKAQEYVRRQLDRPWYLYDLRVGGSDIFIAHIEPSLVVATRSGQMTFAGFIDDMLERVKADDKGLPHTIFPRLVEAHEPKPVQINPGISFGYPTIAGTGIKVRTIAARYDGGEEVKEIAEDYGLRQDQVLDAINFHVAAA